MAVQLFTGNVIAIIWDFDQTLIPGYQQQPLFQEYDIEDKVFWEEVGALVKHYHDHGIEVSQDTVYLNHLLSWTAGGRFPGLNNKKLRELGGQLQFYEGMPEFMLTARETIEGNDEFRRHGILVEHYVVSTGLRQMILGSAIATYVRDVWACEFIDDVAEPGFTEKPRLPKTDEQRVIEQVGYFLDNTTKTKAIWEINKGVNADANIGVNDLIAPEDRRVPPRNMLYVADGPSDVPVFSILNTYGGRTLGVYNGQQDAHFRAVKRLMDQGRVQAMAEADYRDGTQAYKWILATLEEIAKLIVRDRERALVDRVLPPAGHVI